MIIILMRLLRFIQLIKLEMVQNFIFFNMDIKDTMIFVAHFTRKKFAINIYHGEITLKIKKLYLYFALLILEKK